MKAGDAVVFKWPTAPEGEWTGILVTHPRADNPKKWLTVRLKGGVDFTVPPEDVRALTEGE